MWWCKIEIFHRNFIFFSSGLCRHTMGKFKFERDPDFKLFHVWQCIDWEKWTFWGEIIKGISHQFFYQLEEHFLRLNPLLCTSTIWPEMHIDSPCSNIQSWEIVWAWKVARKVCFYLMICNTLDVSLRKLIRSHLISMSLYVWHHFFHDSMVCCSSQNINVFWISVFRVTDLDVDAFDTFYLLDYVGPKGFVSELCAKAKEYVLHVPLYLSKIVYFKI